MLDNKQYDTKYFMITLAGDCHNLQNNFSIHALAYLVLTSMPLIINTFGLSFESEELKLPSKILTYIFE